MKRTLLAALSATVLLLAAPRRASAEYVTLQYNSSTNPTATITLNGATVSNTPVGPFTWTENNDPSNTNFPPPTITYCIEINGALPSPGSSGVFAVETNLANDPALGALKANAIMELYGKYWTPAMNSGGLDSRAFQLALWELVYDGPNAANANSLGTGNFQGTGLSASSAAQTMLNNVTGTNPGAFNTNQYLQGQELVALIAPVPGSPKPQDFQDQLALRPKAVPAPPAILLAGLGLVGLVGRARWNRRKDATA
ncbi:MAG: hypothetical protein K2P78_07120 [Gemmataceae bacterium]|nr:hypothetical protein [Gemmataceae bacterium]MBY0513669.1 hypothetical protein [Gemmataceae bacterium]